MQPHRGTLILVLGILSLVVCGFLGPVAWIMGGGDLKEMRAGRMDPSGEGSTNAGRICGMISSVFLALGFCIIVPITVIATIGSNANSTFQPVGTKISPNRTR
jgi:hypothetical protein